jgi:hypothetical protein
VARTGAKEFVSVGGAFVYGCDLPAGKVSLWKMTETDYGDDMMLSLYFALGIFLLMAVRNPVAHRSLIGFAAWSSFAHGLVMARLAQHVPNERNSLLVAVAVLGIIGVALITLAPAKPSADRVAAAGASANTIKFPSAG